MARLNGGSGTAPGPLHHLGVGVQQLEDPLGGGRRLLQVGVDAAQLLDRPVHQQQRGHERGELARRQPAGGNLLLPYHSAPTMATPPSTSMSGGSIDSTPVTLMLVR